MTSKKLQTENFASSMRGCSVRQLRDALLVLDRKFGLLETMMSGHALVQNDAQTSFVRYAESLADEMQAQGRFKTAQAYRSAVKSLTTCFGREEIALDRIDAASMGSYQTWLLRRGVTFNTVSYYMRILRAIYRRAVRAGLTRSDDPFREVYTGTGRTRKRAVDAELLSVLRMTEFPDSRLRLARDLFLFSFYTRGMSFVDMAYLRQEDVRDGFVRYRRRKTGQVYTVRIIPEVQTILDRYREQCAPWALPVLLDYGEDGLLHPLVFEGATSDERLRFETKLYLRYKYSLSHYLRSLRSMRRRLDLPVGLSFNVARHSWASLARRQGVPVSIISVGLGHTSEKTTQIYLDELDNSAVDAANETVAGLLKKSGTPWGKNRKK